MASGKLRVRFGWFMTNEMKGYVKKIINLNMFTECHCSVSVGITAVSVMVRQLFINVKMNVILFLFLN